MHALLHKGLKDSATLIELISNDNLDVSAAKFCEFVQDSYVCINIIYLTTSYLAFNMLLEAV